MMRKVQRSFTFDAAHRLYQYEGKCGYLHGHTYKAVVELGVKGNELDNMDMLVDFGVLKSKVGGWIDQNWDHAVLLNAEDPLVKFFAEEDDGGFYTFGGNPTAEVMAEYLCEIVENEFPEAAYVKVAMWETASCCAIAEWKAS